MKKIVLLSTLSAALLASFGAHAADTTELKVKGVIRPAACTPSFVGGNTVDYGTIAAKQLKAGENFAPGDRSITLSISCDNDAKIGITASDNRASSRVAGIGTFSDWGNFGLGTVNGKNVGGYAIDIKRSSLVDTAAQAAVLKKDNNASAAWTAVVDTPWLTNTNTTVFSIGQGTTPAKGKKWTLELGVRTVINKPENLDLTGDVPLDGSATLEVVYL